MNCKLYGFGFIRNGVKYDYPFVESFTSLAPICEKVVIVAGDSEDNTKERLQAIPKIEIHESVWDPHLRQGGLILSQQTNLSLHYLRLNLTEQEKETAWAFYLQGDEVLLETEYQQILQDIENAESSGCDVISFRYLHFWQNHRQIAINKKWYPQEIRAIKLKNLAIESWGDAQSFRHFQKVYLSDAHIFHYGHVRKAENYQLKKTDMLKLYHQDHRLKKYRNREKRFDKMTEVLAYLGPHPQVMKERILAIDGPLQLNVAKDVTIFDPLRLITSHFTDNILANNVHHTKIFSLFSFFRSTTFLVQASWWIKLLKLDFFPKKMRSQLARDFSPEFQLILKLSKKKIALKNSF